MPAKSRGRSTKVKPMAPMLESPRRGVLRFGGARTSLMDVFGGFYTIRSVLRRQVGLCEKCLFRDAGREGGIAFVRAGLENGQIPRGEEGFRSAVEAYCQSGFGDFTIDALDWSVPVATLSAREAFEGWAYSERHDKQDAPVCDYTCGVLEGFLTALLDAEGRDTLRVTCRETTCLGAAAAACLYVAGTWTAVSERAVEAPEHAHGRPLLPIANVQSGPSVPVLCRIEDQNQGLQIEISELSERVSDYEKLLANILMSSADAIISMDNSRRILTWNRGAELMYGYTPDEIVGRSFTVLMPSEQLEINELEHIDRILAKQDVLRNYETQRMHKDGRRITVDLSCTVLHDSRGRVIGRSVIHRDITERKRLELELIQSEKLSAIGKLSAHVAHEVRNPLSSIRLNLELLRDECNSGSSDLEETHALLQAIQSEVETLTRFTDEYLQFARVPRLQVAPVDLVELVEELCAFMSEEAEQRSVVLRTQFEPRLPTIPGDATKLRQVLLNLTRNAMEAMGQTGGWIEFTLQLQDRSVMLRVHDSGPGIPQHVLLRIFEPFFTTKEGGTGLGLALSQQIVREHKGRLSATSTPAHGATFTILLPLES